MEDATAECDAVHSRFHDFGDILLGNASDGDERDVDAFFLHFLDDVLISFQSEDRRELLLGGGEAQPM